MHLSFSKEATKYFGISVQRLNKFVQTGKINPLKKNGSGTVFLLEELEKRKHELSIFNEIGGDGEELGMFKIDTLGKQEVFNFVTLMLGRIVSGLAKCIDVTVLNHGFKTIDIIGRI